MIYLSREAKETIQQSLSSLGDIQEEFQENAKTSANKILICDNLIALSHLQKQYSSSIKAVYLDPPYNTGKQFVYDDSQSSVDWQHSLYARLLLIHRLLKDNGVLFLSIDDYEMHHLRILCDDVFGRGNFICNFIWHRSGAGGLRGNFPVSIHEYVLCYVKDRNQITTEWLAPYSEESLKAFRHQDDHGRYKTQALYLTSLRKSPSQAYPIELPDGTMASPPSNKGAWRFVESHYKSEIARGNILFIKTKTSPLLLKDGSQAAYNIYTKQYLNPRGSNPSTLLPQSVGRTRTARAELKGHFGKDVFDYAKPVGLLSHLFNMIGLETNDIILDPYAGSGTTIEALSNIERERDTKLTWIAIQKPTTLGTDHPLLTEGYQTIADILIERIKRVYQAHDREIDYSISTLHSNKDQTT